MQPFNDLILIQADKPRETTKSGLLIAEEWKTVPPTGTILAVGPGVTEERLKPGVRVLFERYASVILENDQRLCKQSHILAILEDDDAATV